MSSFEGFCGIMTNRILQAYLAITRDEHNFTVTAQAASLPDLQHDFSLHGASTLDIGLTGRYHSKINENTPQRILTAFHAYLDNPVRENLDMAPVLANAKGQLIKPGRPGMLEVLRSILVNHSDWYQTVLKSTSHMETFAKKTSILVFGSDAITKSVTRAFSVVRWSLNGALSASGLSTITKTFDPSTAHSSAPDFNGKDPTCKHYASPYPPDAIAVVGMACKFPGAESVDEFWSLLVSGKSTLSHIPPGRFAYKVEESSNGHGYPGSWRTPSSLEFWGNFIDDIDVFDHKFFNKSAREATSMDPQQRLLLQVAYQALASAHYFSVPSMSREKDVGVYIGSCSADYDANVGSHPPTAYATTGTLRAFLSGRISHHFGLTGPSIVFDTACSSSAVAIHTACKALQTGECAQAVAGGVTLITSPYLYENLATAHFLSPSGATKPFDAAADGYCRGEGVGLVVLKRLSHALADCDNVLGVIAGSAVNQNANCMSITVPHSPSQSSLYHRVLAQAGVRPDMVSFVEAHGTGTPVGDPIEMDSLRQVFGGPQRGNSDIPLFISSVKGNIGHLEGASGVAGLIKALLQMEHRIACQQASFTKLNPRISALDKDNLCIPTSNRELSRPSTSSILTACVNNYGAAGSNAALMLMEAPSKLTTSPHIHECDCLKFPVRITASSVASLVRNWHNLDACLKTMLTKDTNTGSNQLLANVAFSLSLQQNPNLPHALTFTASKDLSSLREKFREALEVYGGAEAARKKQVIGPLPVVLCFGGQVGQHVGLSRRLWRNCRLLRIHLDACDMHLQSMGYPSIYPSIFENSPIQDVVVLQTAIFCSQYSCAQAWLGAGLNVDCAIGHSLGQLAAMCVSGVLSLRDGLKLVAGRASLMKTHWGQEPGSMIAVEARQEIISDLLTRLTESSPTCTLEIACYNGPTSQVIVGDERSINALASKLEASGIRHRRLQVSHGFHSRFTDPLVPYLETLAGELSLRSPTIHLETCTEGESWAARPTARLIATHTRDPVYFAQAIERVHKKLGPCTFVEAGGDSGIMGMVRRAIVEDSARPGPTQGNNKFVPLELRSEAALENLAEVTVSLWNGGYHELCFWPFHRKHTAGRYEMLRLPSYQFEKTRHWLPLDPDGSRRHDSQKAEDGLLPRQLPRLLIEAKCKGKDTESQHFHVDKLSNEFQALVGGYTMLGKAECPPSLYVELAARAVTLGGNEDDSPTQRLLEIQNFRLGSPLFLDTTEPVDLCLRRVLKTQRYNFEITSQVQPPTADPIVHATGTIFLCPDYLDSRVQDEFDRFERFATLTKNLVGDASSTSDPDSVSVTGALVYKLGPWRARRDISSFYKGVKSLSVTLGGKCAVARIEAPLRSACPAYLDYSIVKLHILEALGQVAYLHANMIHGSSDNFFFLNGMKTIQYGPGFVQHMVSGPSERQQNTALAWEVLALVSEHDKAVVAKLGQLTYDIFVQDASSGKLVAVILGVYVDRVRVQIPPSALRTSFITADPEPVSLPLMPTNTIDRAPESLQVKFQPPDARRESPVPSVASPTEVIFLEICTILEEIAEISQKEVRGNATFDDLGIDSLMLIEVIGEISTLYKIDLPLEDLEKLTDFNSLVGYLVERGCQGGQNREALAVTRVSSVSSTSVTEEGSFSRSSATAPSSPKEEPYSTADSERWSSRNSTENFKQQLPERHQVPGAYDSPQSTHNARSIQKAFNDHRMDIGKYNEQTGFSGFWESVHPVQERLVQTYIVDAFRQLGVNLADLAVGEQLGPFKLDILPKYASLMQRLHRILLEYGLIAALPRVSEYDEPFYFRTQKGIDPTPAATLLQLMLEKFPEHASETKLMDITGSVLAKCLTGEVDPLRILFANKTNRAVMADVYEKAPMCQATTRSLADFVSNSFKSTNCSKRVIRIIEVGGGTGGTAKYLVNHLVRQGIDFIYHFTDISSSMVTQARNVTFADKHNIMEFATLDCEAVPPHELCGLFDVVVATNCIHATRDTVSTARNMASLLRPDGIFCMVEFTRGLYWFDLVYGLLDGWWAFDDGRTHALADQWFWESSLKAAGFGHVAWTDGISAEAQTMRVIVGFLNAAEDDSFKPLPKGIVKKAGLPVETFTWKTVDGVSLQSDVYYPKIADEPGRTRTVGMLNLTEPLVEMFI